MAYKMIQIAINTVTAYAQATKLSSMALVGFIYQPLKNIKCWWPDVVLDNGPRMFIRKISSWPEAVNRRSPFWWSSIVPCPDHDRQSATVVYSSFTIFGQWNLCHSNPYRVFSPGWPATREQCAIYCTRALMMLVKPFARSQLFSTARP